MTRAQRLSAEQLRVITAFVYHAVQPSSYLMDLSQDRRQKYIDAAAAGCRKAGIELEQDQPPTPPAPAVKPEQQDLFADTA